MVQILITNRKLKDETQKLGYPGMCFQGMGLILPDDPPFIYYTDSRYKDLDTVGALKKICAEINKSEGLARIFYIPAIAGYFTMLSSLEKQAIPVAAFSNRHLDTKAYDEIESTYRQMRREIRWNHE